MTAITRRSALALGLFSAAAIGFGAVDRPTVAAADFSGKTVEWIIPFGTGGGSDVWARFFAPRLSEALPGKPTVVIQNIPGGGSTIGANQFHQNAKPDGLTILGTSGSTQFPYLLDDPRVKFDYRDWIPVLASPVGGVVFTNPAMGVTGAADMMKLKGQRLVYGSQGATSLDLVPLLAFEMLGWEVKPVFGMKSRGEGRLAFERGEATLDYQTTPAYNANVVPLVETGKAVPLFSWGVLDAKGNLARDPSFPDLPHYAEAFEMATGKAPSGEAWQVWKAFFAAGFAAQKMVFLPKGTPDDIVKAYRQAFVDVVNASGFRDAAGEELGKYEQGVGDAVIPMYETATRLEPGDKAWVKKWLVDRYNVKFD